MSRSRSRWTIIGNAGCRRIARFQAALALQGDAPARLVSYSEVLSKSIHWSDVLRRGDLVRLESAAENWQTRQQLLNYGYELACAEGYAAADPQLVARCVTSDASPEFKSRQLYLGYRRLLQEIQSANDFIGAVPIQLPSDVLCMFDKASCQQRLHAAQVAVPRLLAQPRSYEEVRQASGPDGRTMLKMSHGSGGVGCIAMHWSRGRVRAFVSSQTVQMVDPRLADINIPVQKINDESILATVIDTVCQEQAHLEAWEPKARFQGKPFDLRVVVIAGQACHAIARLGSSPFTNLNLGGKRLDINQTDSPISKDLWQKVQAFARQVAGCFPQTLYFGLDLLVSPQGKLRVIEVNAFGDLLLNITRDARDSYAAEIAAAPTWLKDASAGQHEAEVATA